MQWSQIKTLFIITFLILNVYLLVQLYDKQKQPEGLLEHQEESSIEEQLAEDEIQIPDLEGKLDAEKEPFITVEQQTFSEEELAEIDILKEQSYDIIDENLIVSKVNSKQRISKKASKSTIVEAVQDVIPFIDEYVFWEWDQDLNIIMFFQEKNKRPVYYNPNGLILIFLNDKNEIEYYSLSKLSEEEKEQEERTLITPMEAIETLYNSGELFYEDEVNSVEVGFHTRIPSTNGVQVFVPTWQITVNDSRNYFINAIEGFVFSSEEHEFLEETLRNDLEKIQSYLSDNDKQKKEIVNLYKDKLDGINLDEEE